MAIDNEKSWEEEIKKAGREETFSIYNHNRFDQDQNVNWLALYHKFFPSSINRGFFMIFILFWLGGVEKVFFYFRVHENWPHKNYYSIKSKFLSFLCHHFNFTLDILLRACKKFALSKFCYSLNKLWFYAYVRMKGCEGNFSFSSKP